MLKHNCIQRRGNIIPSRFSYFLSAHKSILTTYDVAFRAGDYYVMATEYAPFGDLACYVSNGGVGERNTKILMPQLVSALDFMHSKRLVHRNVRLDNILVFKSDLSRVKLADFDQTRPYGWKARRGDEWPPYTPPEVQKVEKGATYDVTPAHDTWQLAIVLLVCLNGALPWQRAEPTDARYAAFHQWRGYRALRAPQRFGEFTLRFQSLLRRLLDPRPMRRATVNELARCGSHKWVARSAPASTVGDPDSADATSVCYSTWSVHSCVREKNLVLGSLRACGLETVVDRDAKRQRLREWVAMTAVSTEEIEAHVEEEGRGGSTGSASSYRQRSLTDSIPEEDED